VLAHGAVACGSNPPKGGNGLFFPFEFSPGEQLFFFSGHSGPVSPPLFPPIRPGTRSWCDFSFSPNLGTLIFSSRPYYCQLSKTTPFRSEFVCMRLFSFSWRIFVAFPFFPPHAKATCTVHYFQTIPLFGFRCRLLFSSRRHNTPLAGSFFYVFCHPNSPSQATSFRWSLHCPFISQFVTPLPVSFCCTSLLGRQ